MYVYNNGLTDFKPLIALSELIILHAQGNFFTDINRLQQLNQLYDIILAGNPIEDCHPADLLQNLMGPHWCEEAEPELQLSSQTE